MGKELDKSGKMVEGTILLKTPYATSYKYSRTGKNSRRIEYLRTNYGKTEDSITFLPVRNSNIWSPIKQNVYTTDGSEIGRLDSSDFYYNQLGHLFFSLTDINKAIL